MQDGDRAGVGQRVWPGDTVGQVGSTGELARGNHLHYSILPASAGRAIENPNLPHNGGPIGIRVNETDTIDPAKYDPQPYLDESQRAVRMMAGVNGKPPLNGTPSPDRPDDPLYSPFGKPFAASAGTAPPASPGIQNPVADRFGEWGSVPFPKTPAASDDPAGFNDRHGNWASSPAGVLGNFNPPPSRADLGQRSEANDDAPVRVLSRAMPPPTPASGDVPTLALASASPPLGIFSGQPMPDRPVWPSIFDAGDRSSPEDDELFQRWRRWVDA